MTYQASLSPMSKEELATVPCFKYINLDVPERELEQWDMWFMEHRRTPDVYSLGGKGWYTFFAKLGDQEVDVDWRIYRTWANTFHHRYEPLLIELGLKTSNPHFHPEDQFQIAKLMDEGARPKALADCHIETNLH